MTEQRMTRRDVLQTAAVASTGLITMNAHAQAADAKTGYDVKAGYIDAHSHIWTRDLDKYPLAGKQTVDDLKPPSFTSAELLKLVRPLGVSRVVLIQHKPYHGLDNSYITDAIAENPGVFSAVACIDASAADPTKAMDKLKKLGARGFRIRPGEGGADRWAESNGMRKMWEHGGKTGLAMCPLINPQFLGQVDEMCRKYPDTNVVIDHFARIGISGKIEEADLKKLSSLSKHKHVHVKISAFYALGDKKPPHTELIPMIRRLYDSYGPERLMWASDSPYQIVPPNTYNDSLALVTSGIDFLSKADQEWVLRKTAEKVYFS